MKHAPNDNGILGWLGPVLASHAITRFEAMMSGSGDSGDLDDIVYFGLDGVQIDSAQMMNTLRALSVDDGSPSQHSFYDDLVEYVLQTGSEYGDYCNNEGGAVHLSYLVEGDTITLDSGEYTPGEYSDDDEYNDDEPDNDDGPDDCDVHPEDDQNKDISP